jgi:ribosomal protein S18 acetylase RimI-like enzyme
MSDAPLASRVRPLDELDIGAIVRIDERLSGIYRPDFWEQRVMFSLRRDPEGSQVAEVDGRVVGFMLGDLRAGEFGIDEACGWIDRFGLDPECRGRDLGRGMYEAMVAHFRAQGATSVRTLVDRKDTAVAGFLEKLGFAPSPLQALEVRITPTAEEAKR